ncbi:hypothetical protein [Faecalibacterium sp. An77]|uniref:hypothetical protein n=1 Tax=Faecalibacterium sp. An77 TaxID=1965655 RepID=UPI001186FE38|nr:hypothetical protein [Faecalibacterium sp. An77]
MKQLIAKRSILYQNRMYAPGEALPAADGRMAKAWLRAGSAVWQEDTPPAEMLTGHLAQLNEMTKAQLLKLAGELGLDALSAKTKIDLVALIGAAEVQAPAEAVQDTDDETQPNDDEGTQ